MKIIKILTENSVRWKNVGKRRNESISKKIIELSKKIQAIIFIIFNSNFLFYFRIRQKIFLVFKKIIGEC